MKSDRTLKDWYREINTKFFDNELPDNVCVRWAEEDDHEELKDHGDAGPSEDGYHLYEIRLNKELKESAKFRLSTLLHEMVHIATLCRDEHADAFDRWHKVLVEKGAFKKSAIYKGITLF